jgi:hypothetical protein
MAKNSKITMRARKDSATREQKPRRSLRGRATADAIPGLNPGMRTTGNTGPSPGIQPVETSMTKFTFYTNPTLTLVCVPSEAPALFSLDAAADLTGVHPEMLRYYCRCGLLGENRAEIGREPTFDKGTLYEVRRIEHYRRHLAISRRALPLICELRRKAERQHIEIHFLRGP